MATTLANLCLKVGYFIDIMYAVAMTTTLHLANLCLKVEYLIDIMLCEKHIIKA